MPRPSSRLSVRELEDRTAPANLRITSLQLVNGNNVPIAATPVGEQIYVRATWDAQSMTAGQQYVVRFQFNGATFDTGNITTTGGSSSGWNWYRPLWFARPGSNTASATVDGANAIGESDESDNTQSVNFTAVAPVGPGTKFVWPVSAKPAQSYRVNNYSDVDPRAGFAADYRGGPFQYDGHDAFDIDTTNHARMDAGMPILAAAPGTVNQVQDGNFDREITSNSNPANYVRIDHGGGWETLYYHLAADSITVKVGDVVAAGQLIGLMGSSGSSTQAHLHFTTIHNNAVVEPMEAPAAYFADPPLYQGDADPVVTAAGATNYDVFATGDWKEGPSNVGVFPTSGNWTAWAWFNISNFPTGQTATASWYRPDGSLYTSSTLTPSNSRGGYYAWTLSSAGWSSALGTWNVILTIGGKEKGRTSFRVISGSGEPEVRVRDGSLLMPDKRTTPVNFGSVAQNGTPPQKTFTVQNHGAAPLDLSNLRLPTGFSLVSAFPTSIAVAGSATLTVRMDAAVVGNKYGALRFTTNDTDEGDSTFLLKGTVTGTPVAGTPAMALSGPAVAFVMGDAARQVAPTATVSDPDNASYAGGTLTVRVEMNGTVADRLDVRNQGTGIGQVGVSGNTVTYEGTAIGTFTAGDGQTPLTVAFNAASTPAAVQAVLRNVTYRNVSDRLDGRPRFLLTRLVDPDGKSSGDVVKRVSIGMDPRNDAPTFAGPGVIPAVLEDTSNPPGVAVRSFTDAAVTDPDVYDPKGVAVTGLGTAVPGAWQYSIDGGVTWKGFGAVSATAARLLRETDLIRFTPTPDSFGTNTLSYRAWDQSTGLYGTAIDLNTTATGGATAYSATEQTATLEVAAVNDAPNFTAGPDRTVAEDAGPQAFNGWATGMTRGPANESGQALTFLISSDLPALFAAGPAVDPGTGTLTFTPTANAHGTANVTVTLQDGGGTANGGVNESAPRSFKITVSPVNDAPVVGDDLFYAQPSPVVGDVVGTVTAADVDNDTLTFSITAGDSNGNFTIDSAGNIKFASLANLGGTYDLTVKAADPAGLSDTGVIRVVVNNTAPTTVTVSVPPVDEDADPFTVDLGSAFDDAEQPDSELTYTIRNPSVPPPFASASVSGTTLTLTPVADANGFADFIIRATDAGNLYSEATIRVTVNAVNDVPRIDPVADRSFVEDDPAAVVDLAGILPGPANEAGQVLTVTAASSNRALVPDPAVVYTSPGGTGQLRFTLPPDVSSPTDFADVTVTVGDGTATTTRTFRVTVTPAPDRPKIDTSFTPMLPAIKVPIKTAIAPISVADLVANVTDPDANAQKGIAVTGFDSRNGKWEYITAAGGTWMAFPAVSDNAALLLTDDAGTQVRFVPNKAAKGVRPFTKGFADLTYRVWDRSDGASPESPLVDAGAPGTTAYSSEVEHTWVAVGKTVPTLDPLGRPVLKPMREDTKQSSVYTVKAFLGLLAKETDRSKVFGIAVSSTSGNGTWQYLAGKSGYQPIGTVTDASALLLRPTDKVRFKPDPNFDGDAQLTYHTWDLATGTTGDKKDTSLAGFSAATETAIADIIAVNDAPVLNITPTPTFGSIRPGELTPSRFVSDFLVGVTSDVEGATLGMYVTRAAGGTWAYKSGAGDWTPITKPVYLTADAELQFTALPTAKPGATATLSFKAWEASTPGRPVVSRAAESVTVTILAP